MDAFDSFQNRVSRWAYSCFGKRSMNVKLRCARFLEEALELVQSLNFTREDAHSLVDYVYDRKKGQVHQELGGTMTTLAALSAVIDEDMEQAGNDELDRVNRPEIFHKIQNKEKQKPKLGLAA